MGMISRLIRRALAFSAIRRSYKDCRFTTVPMCGFAGAVTTVEAAGARHAARAEGRSVCVIAFSTTAAIIIAFAGAINLHGWAWDRTVGTKHAAIAQLGAKDRLAVDALVKVLAGVCRHES